MMVVDVKVGGVTTAHPIGSQLRLWRERRRFSQLDLANLAEISTRHLSFVETGRSAPSRDMVLTLTDYLEVPLRERNKLLLAAGYAPVYAESAFDAPQLASVRAALRQVLDSHEPYPAVVSDRSWNLVEANSALSLFTDLVAPHLLAPPANVMRASLHPQGLAQHIVNHGEWRAHLLTRLRRQIEITADPGLTTLHKELSEYPCPQPEPALELPGPAEILVPLRLRVGNLELRFFSIIATFGTPMDITLAELAIESFFPADPSTAELLRSLSKTQPGNGT